MQSLFQTVTTVEAATQHRETNVQRLANNAINVESSITTKSAVNPNQPANALKRKVSQNKATTENLCTTWMLSNQTTLSLMTLFM